MLIDAAVSDGSLQTKLSALFGVQATPTSVEYSSSEAVRDLRTRPVYMLCFPLYNEKEDSSSFFLQQLARRSACMLRLAIANTAACGCFDPWRLFSS